MLLEKKLKVFCHSVRRKHLRICLPQIIQRLSECESERTIVRERLRALLRVRVCVCVCVRERESEREKDNVCLHVVAQHRCSRIFFRIFVPEKVSVLKRTKVNPNILSLRPKKYFYSKNENFRCWLKKDIRQLFGLRAGPVHIMK